MMESNEVRLTKEGISQKIPGTDSEVTIFFGTELSDEVFKALTDFTNASATAADVGEALAIQQFNEKWLDLSRNLSKVTDKLGRNVLAFETLDDAIRLTDDLLDQDFEAAAQSAADLMDGVAEAALEPGVAQNVQLAVKKVGSSVADSGAVRVLKTLPGATAVTSQINRYSGNVWSRMLTPLTRAATRLGLSQAVRVVGGSVSLIPEGVWHWVNFVHESMNRSRFRVLSIKAAEEVNPWGIERPQVPRRTGENAIGADVTSVEQRTENNVPILEVTLTARQDGPALGLVDEVRAQIRTDVLDFAPEGVPINNEDYLSNLVLIDDEGSEITGLEKEILGNALLYNGPLPEVLSEEGYSVDIGPPSFEVNGPTTFFEDPETGTRIVATPTGEFFDNGNPIVAFSFELPVDFDDGTTGLIRTTESGNGKFETETLVDAGQGLELKFKETVTGGNDFDVSKVEEFDAQGNVVNTDTNIEVSGQLVDFEVISSFASSAVGGLIANAVGADSSLERRLIGAASAPFVNAFGELLNNVIYVPSAANGVVLSLSDKIDDAFDQLGPELKANLLSAGVGAFSSFLAAELVDGIGLSGFAGDLANQVTSTAFTNLISNAGSIANGTTSIGTVLQGVELVNLLGSLVGSKFASEIATFETVGGQLGSTFGGSFGALAGATAATSIAAATGIGTVTTTAVTQGVLQGTIQTSITTVSSIVPVVGTIAGVIVGYLLGGVIGSLFGGTPRSGADVRWRDGQFDVGNVWARKGGSAEAAEAIASQAAGTLNGVMATIGGELLNGAEVRGGTYGMRKSEFTYREAQSRDKADIKKKSDEPGDVLSHGVYTALTDFQIAGGDAIAKRALSGTLASSNTTNFDINAVLGDLLIASDYRRYLENPLNAAAIIAAAPESTEGVGWTITLVRAIELGLHKRAASDWYGGWDVALGVYDGPEGAEYTPGQLEFDLVGKERVTSLIDAEGGFVIGSYGDTIDTAGKDEIDVSGDLTVSGDTIADTAGLTINGAAPDAASHTIDVAAVIRGDSNDNIIRAGDLGNDVFGGDGNDTLYGGTLDDWLFGGDGADYIYAGNYEGENGPDAGSGNYLDGGAGNDHLFGGTGSDWLEGGAGDDILKGGEGDDILSGGTDAAGGTGGSGGGKALNFTGDFLFSVADTFSGQTDLDGITIAIDVEPNDARGRIFELQNTHNVHPRLSVDVQQNGDLKLGIRGQSVTFDANLSSADGKRKLIVTWDRAQGLARLFEIDSQGTAVEISAISNSASSSNFNQLIPNSDLNGGGRLLLGGSYRDDGTSLTQTTDWANYFGAYSKLQLWDQSFLDGDVSGAAPVYDFALDTDTGTEIIDRANPGVTYQLIDNQHEQFPGTFNANEVWIDDPYATGGGSGGTASPIGDILDGGAGNDQYLVRLNDGLERILESASPVADTQSHLDRLLVSGYVPILAEWRGTSVHETADNVAAGGEDVLVLGPGIGWDDVRMKRGMGPDGLENDDLIITIQTALSGEPNNIITLEDWYGQRETRVEKLRLADGQEIDLGYTNFFTGTNGNDLIIGTDGRDFVISGSDNDFVSTLGDEDFANGGADHDVVSGGDGRDLVIGSTGDDIVAGDAGNDAVQGGAGDDHVMGNDGDDVLSGGAGRDILVGGAGNDVFQFGRGDGQDILVDQLATSSWSVIFRGPDQSSPNQNPAQGNYERVGQTIYDGPEADGNVVYRFGEMHEWIYWDLSGSGEATWKQDLVQDQAGLPDIGGGGQVYHYTGPTLGTGLANGAETANAGIDIIEFDIGIDIADIHMEQRGDDLFIGIGAADGSSVAFDALEDTVIIADWFDASGAGKAIEEFLFFHTGTIITSQFDMWGGGSDGDNTIAGGALRDWLTGNAGNDTLEGLGGDDILNGNGGQDTLDGGAGDDVLFGGAGNDILIGGSGNSDILLGGSGLDVASYAGASGVTASLANSAANLGDALGDEFDSIEGLIGSSQVDTLIGDQFDNEITGGLGDDTLEGGLGNDAYLFAIGDGADTIDDIGGDDDILSFDVGIALEDLSFSYSGSNNENLIIAYGSDDITIQNFTASDTKIETLQFADGTFANLAGLIIDGSAASNDTNHLIIGDGTVSGGQSDDVLRGGDGADQLLGGDGNDVLVGGSGSGGSSVGYGLLIDEVNGTFNGPNGERLYLDGLFTAPIDGLTVQVELSTFDSEGEVFSYLAENVSGSAARNLYELSFKRSGEATDLILRVGAETATFSVGALLSVGDTHAVAASWDRTSGVARVFVDGAEIGNGQLLSQGYSIPINGGIGIAQEFRNLTETSVKGLEGLYSDIKVWGTALDAAGLQSGATNDLISHVPLSEGSGIVVNDAQRNNTSYTILGPATWHASSDGPLGLGFDGGTALALDVGPAAPSGDFSISFDYTPGSGSNHLFSHVSTNGTLSFRAVSSANYLRFDVGSNTISYNAPIGEKRNITITWDDSTKEATIYDHDSGDSSSAVFAGADPAFGDGRLIIGQGYQSNTTGITPSTAYEANKGFNGRISDFKIWDQTLTAGQINNPPSAGLMHDLDFKAGGTSIPDVETGQTVAIDGTYNWLNAPQGSGGGAGDELNGGADSGSDGGDWVSYAGSDSPINVDLGANTSSSSTATGGDAEGDWYIDIESVAGSSHDDVIAGNAENNVLKGYHGIDTLSGAEGDDVLLGEDGNDILTGGTGEDNLSGGEGDDDLFGGADNDTLFGDAGNDALQGDAGADLLIGGDGNDVIAGGSENDTLQGDAGNDILSGGDGDDVITAGTGQDSMSGGTGNDVYVATLDAGHADTVTNGGGKDVLILQNSVISDLEFSASGANLLIRDVVASGTLTIMDWRAQGAELRYIEAAGQRLSSFDLAALLASNGLATGEDHSILWQTPALYVDNAVYTDTDAVNNLAPDLEYTGGATFNGLAGDDTITGTAFGDIIDGGTGNDTLNGGAGDDTFVYQSDTGHDIVDGGDGIDRILAVADESVIRIQSLSQVEEISAGGLSNVRFDGGSLSNAVFDFSTMLIDGITDYTFGNNRQVVTGTDGDDIISAGAGDDVISAGAGNDVLVGGSGNDVLDGGAGIDTADFTDGPAARNIDLGAFEATGGETDTLTDIENVIGSSGADTITGDDNANSLDGGAGDDDLNGGAGDDILIGGAGIDAFFGGAGYDIVDYSSRTSAVEINVAGSLLDGGTETYTDIELFVGTDFDDLFIGDGGNNQFRGGAGNDSFDGGPGGNDFVYYNGNLDGFTLNPDGTLTDIDLRDGDEGTDTFSGINWLLFADGGSIERGQDANNAPTAPGTIESQTVRATDPFSLLIPSGAFNDQDDDPLTVTVERGDGTALPSFINVTVDPNDAAVVTLSGTPAADVHEGLWQLRAFASDGQADSGFIYFSIEVTAQGDTIDGTADANNLIGGDGHDTLNALGGDDVLQGLAGRDELNGGEGSDTASYAASNALIQVNLGLGTASGGHAQGDQLDNIENVIGSQFGDMIIGDGVANILSGGDGGDILAGGAGDDHLFGQAGIDVLSGDGGNDTLDGGAGVDTLSGGGGDDLIIADASSIGETYDGGTHGGGGDTLSFADFGVQVTADLSSGTIETHSVSNIENIIATDFDDTVTGNSAANVIMAGGGDDVINGSAGEDTVDGGLGDDHLSYANASAGVVAVLSGTGTSGWANGDAISNVENLTGSSYGDTLWGDGEINYIWGGDGDDTIYGLGSGDHLYGGLGNDTIYGDGGEDTIRGGDGDDIIEAGSEGDHLHGEGGNDVLRGGAGDDTYHLGRNTGHDVIDNYAFDETNEDAQDVIVYNIADAVTYDALWFERGTEAGGNFIRDDAAGLDLRVSVLGAGASVVVKNMLDSAGNVLDEYSVDLFNVSARHLSKTEVSDLLDLMDDFTSLPTSSTVPSSISTQVDTIWGFNSAPEITYSGPSSVTINENDGSTGGVDTTVDLYFTVADTGTNPVSASSLTLTALDQGNLITGVIDSVIDGDPSQRKITLEADDFTSGSTTIRVTLSDGGLTDFVDIALTVNPVAQVPTLEVGAPTLNVNAGDPISLPSITPSLTDTAEALSVRISGVPAGASLNKGDRSGDTYTLTPSQLSGLTLQTQSGSNVDFDLFVVAVSEETNGATATSVTETINVIVDGPPTDIQLSSQTVVEESANASVGVLTMTDTDTGSSVDRFDVVGGAFASSFTTVKNGNQWELWTTNVRLDYEATPGDLTRDIEIEVTDNAGNTYSEIFDITLTPLDEKPSQPSNPGNITKSEVQVLSVPLGGAVDPEGADVNYSFRLENNISGNPGGFFTIVNGPGNTAELRANTPSGRLDFETIKHNDAFQLAADQQSGYFDISFLATDRDVSDPNAPFSDVYKSEAQTFRITVENENDEAPDTPASPYHENFNGHFENNADDILVASFTRTDPDGPTPDLKLVGDDKDEFYVSGDHVYLKAGRDAEATDGSVLLQVRTNDGVRDSSGMYSRTISIGDINEHAPIINNPGVIIISEAQSPANPLLSGGIQVQLTASDSDISDEDDLVWTSNSSAIDIDSDGYLIVGNDFFNFEALSGTDPNVRTATASFSVSDGDNTVSRTVTFDVQDNPDEPTALILDPIDSAIWIFDSLNSLVMEYPQFNYFGSVFTNQYSIYESGELITRFIYHPVTSTFAVNVQTAEGYYWDERTFYASDELVPITPIILDLDDDGVEMVVLSASPIWFDQNDDGTLDQTGWVGADDALLVLDRNDNGVIDGGAEISFVQDLPGATTDMEGLAAYDSNGDGVFDGADSDYGRFQLWQDENQDGVSQAQELSSLDEAGISAIDLALTPTGQTLENTPGNVMFNTAAFERTDGSLGTIGDVAFRFRPGESFDAQRQQLEKAIPLSAVETDRQLQSLVQAMATFSPDAGAAPLGLSRQDDPNAANWLTATTRWASEVV